MKSILAFIISFCLAVPQLQPLGICMYKSASNNKDNNVTDSTEDNTLQDSTQQASEVVEPSTEDVDSDISTNYTVDIDGYATVNINNTMFTQVAEMSSSTKQVWKYQDQKTRITMSYITNLDSSLDIPGYMCKEVAGIDTLTNSKYEEDHAGKTWMIIPADKVINDMNCTVYYVLDDDSATAFWMLVQQAPESVSDTELNASITAIMDSYNCYYSSSTVFKTPTTGYYKDKAEKDNTVAKDTDQYLADSKDNTVHKTNDVGFTGAAISDDWEDMQIILDGVKYQLPNPLSTFLQGGYFLNDYYVTSGKTEIDPAAQVDVQLLNNKGTTITATIINTSTTKTRKAMNCAVIKLVVDSAMFVPASKAKKIKTGKETDTKTTKKSSKKSKSNNGKKKSSSSKKKSNKKSSTSDHEVIIAKGIDFDIYLEDLLSSFGDDCYYESLGDKMNQYTWKNKDDSMIIITGPVQGIKKVTLSTVANEDSYYSY
jgi:hypothetical protein